VHARGRVALAPVAAVAVILLATALLPPSFRGAQQSVSTHVAQAGATGSAGSAGSAAARHHAEGSRRGPGRALAAPSPASAPAPAHPDATGPAASRSREVATHGLRIGVVAPSADVLQAVGAAVAAGKQASLVVLSPSEVATADVDVVVGGSTAPRLGTPWLLPADPYAGGPGVVRAELDPAEAGAVLADDLIGHGLRGRIGAVVQNGPDATLADGVATRLPVVRADAPAGTDCNREVSQLRFSGVVALAVAGPPALAQACVAAALSIGLPVPGGILLAPSAAYGGVAATGTRTVLGLPWPGDESPGAGRFATATRSTTYPALVAFAATELAGAMGTTGSITPDALQGTWQTDLVDIQHGRNAGAAVVVARNGTWMRGWQRQHSEQ